mgnify:CR=1 FL=1
MEKDYSLPEYDDPRRWINTAREKGKSWDYIEFAGKDSETGLKEFISSQAEINWWKIDTVDWHELVKLQKLSEENTQRVSILCQQATITGPGEDGTLNLPADPRSSWQLYRKLLLSEKHFRPEAVSVLEKSTLGILNRLKPKTKPGDAVKGLVIGNVQSGKTASMAGLMAMSADWGWNMFIILSGTIENLRKQTQSRLFSDLNRSGNLTWRSMEHLSRQSPQGSRAQDLHFETQSADRYLTVCLKNSVRLKKLIQWLQADPNKQKQMRILVIDDEADQAGVNTGKIGDTEEETERKRINQLIVNLVAGLNDKGKAPKADYEAINYIGYTATPYANILNESGQKSLYPRSFITTLGVPKEYFGPQQIFGVTGGSYDGLDIVRTIPKKDLNVISDIHFGGAEGIPESLKRAVCWFVDCVACMRLWKYGKSVSMLIHTSQRTPHHANIEKKLSYWLENTGSARLLDMCRETWEAETSAFGLQKFGEQYPDYSCMESVRDYPPFSDIEPFVRTLTGMKLTHIQMSDEGDLRYNDGIHICVDNCMNNGVSEEGMYMRIAYPEKQEDLDRTPAFIVIGGQTLSRGLTLEGLVSTYFLRSVGQADTLMQMGRWFGYRRGYELLPRIWLTQKTIAQFHFLSDLDQALRDEIYGMDLTGRTASEYGPRVRNTPSCSFLRITAKNRMQRAEETDVDYSGLFTQTYLFDEDPAILRNNIDATQKLIADLGTPDARPSGFSKAKNATIWRGVSFSVIEKYLRNYHLQENMHLHSTIDSLIDWIGKITSEGKLDRWNVVLSGAGGAGRKIQTAAGEVGLTTRSRKSSAKPGSGIIDIGALRNPRDILADVDYENLPKDVADLIDHCTSGQVKGLRSKAGLATTPQLILYFVDRNSKVKCKSVTRKDLDAPEDLAGYCLNIPGGKAGQNCAASVAIRLSSVPFDGEADLEGTDGN